MNFRDKILKFRFNLTKRIGLYEKIAAFLEADIDLNASLRTIRDRYALRKDFRAVIISRWLAKADAGQRFADAIAEWIPPGELMLIEAGERGGGLITGLQEAVVLSNASAKNVGAIKTGMAMPTVLVGMLVGMLIMFRKQMVPTFEALMPVEKWPATPKILYGLSSFFYDNLFILLVVFIGISVLIGKTIGGWTKDPRRIFDKLPPWSIYRGYQASSFLIALSSLMRAGVPAFEALQAMNKNASPWMRAHLKKMMDSMSRGGGNMGQALDTGLLDDETAGDVQDYSRLGSFSDAIYLLGSRSLINGVKQIEARMGFVNKFMLFLVAGSIMWIYAASFELQTAIADSQGAGK